MFSPSQYGFRKSRNTIQAVIKLTELVRESPSKKEKVACLFLDLSKAFDTVDHNILLDKLNDYGFRGVATGLISSYLSNRTLLFLIYINDLEQVAVNNNIDLTLFADDSTFTAYDKFEALNVLRNEIPEIKKWCETNRLQLNPNKSKTLFSQVQKIVPCP